MSHEFRTPLNAILGFGQLLEMGDINGRERENVVQVLKAGKHLLSLVNDILDVARIETGKLSMSMESVNLMEALDSCLNLTFNLAKERKIGIEINDIDGQFVIADQQRLVQVLVNLVSNAIKYNREDGKVVISSRNTGSNTEIIVRDTGKGIDLKHLELLFQPFERLDFASSQIDGIGLGLTVTKSLIEAMQGTIVVESSSEEGTTFIISLRQCQRHHSQSAIDSNGSDHSQEYKILYIDDNAENIALVKGALQAYHHIHLETTTDGGVGLELAGHLNPDLILLDLHLEGLSGLQVLEAIKSNEQTRTIKVVIMSAVSNDEVLKAAFALGAEGSCSKPVNIVEFISEMLRYSDAA
jgi:CheY-like chemotaxis protein